MKLEDALFCMVIDAGMALDVNVPEICRAAIAGGVDVVRMECDELNPEKSLLRAKEIADVCRVDDALFVIGDNLEIASAVKADGVHFSSLESSIGMAKTCLGMDSIVGVSSATVDDMILAIEVGADYVVHLGATASPLAFAALNGANGVPLFSGAITGKDDVRELVGSGVYRFCIDSTLLGRENITQQAVEFSCLLGRCM